MFFLVCLSVCFLCLGIVWLWLYFRDERREYILLYGRVIRYDLKKKITAERFIKRSYVPVFEYEYAGKTYQKRHRISSFRYGKGMKPEPNFKYKIGDTVELRVYKEAPDYALLNDTHNIRLPLYVGIPLIFAGAILFAYWVSECFF